MGSANVSDEFPPSAIARLRVERLLTHFRRFLAPDDDKILLLEQRLATLQPESSQNLSTRHAVALY